MSLDKRFPLEYPPCEPGCNHCNPPIRCGSCATDYNTKSDAVKHEFVGVKWTDDGPVKFTYKPKLANDLSRHHKETWSKREISDGKRVGKVVEHNGRKEYYIDEMRVSREQFSRAGFL